MPSNVDSSRRGVATEGHPASVGTLSSAGLGRLDASMPRSSSRRFVAVRAPERASCSRERCERSSVRTVTSASVSRFASCASPRESASRSAASSATVRCRHTLFCGEGGEAGSCAAGAAAAAESLRCGCRCRCSAAAAGECCPFQRRMPRPTSSSLARNASSSPGIPCTRGSP